ADRLRRVACVQLEVDLEQVDDREVRGRFAVSDRTAFEDEPAVRALCLAQFIAQAGFADARLPHEADDLPTTLGDLSEEVAQVCQLPLPAYETTQRALPVHLQRGASRSHPHDSVGADTISYACTRWSLPPVQFKPSLHHPPDLGRQQNIPWRGLPEQPYRQRQRLPQWQEPRRRVARLAIHQHLAEMDRHPHLWAWLPAIQSLVLRQLMPESEGGLHGALRPLPP